MAEIGIQYADSVAINQSTHTINYESRCPSKVSTREGRFASKVKRASRNRTNQNVVSEFTGDLQEPGFEVFPVLMQVDFYRGENAAGARQYTPESNFSSNAEKWIGKRVKFKNLHAKLGEKTCRHVSLVGGAGTGKTTLLKRYARLVIDQKIVLGGRTGPFASRNGKNIVIYINVRDLPTEGTFTPCDFLIKCAVKELDSGELDAGYRWLINHQERCLFVIDGLDQYDWELENETTKIDYHSQAGIPSIVYNLLCGELFPNAWVLTSSRPHKIRFFQDKLRADKVVALNGLENTDIKRLACALPKSDGTVWKRLSEKCPKLLVMCKTPLFLIFTILVFMAKEDFSRDTMAGVMTVLIQCFIETKHATHPDIVDKLKQLAFEGTNNKRVIFTDEDFNSVGLRPDVANDLFVFAPKKTHIMIRQRLLSKDYVMFFCHQSVQEAFTAFFISEMGTEEFREFVLQNINSPHFSVVRRLLCGLLLNEETFAAATGLMAVSDLEAKKSILLESLKQIIQTRLSTQDYLEFLASLYEAGSGVDSIMTAHPREISVTREPLTVSDIYVVGRVLRKLDYADLIEFWDTRMDCEKMEVLWREMSSSSVKVKKIDIHSNYQHDFGCDVLGNILNHCDVEDLDINDCALTDNKIKKLRSFGSNKLKKLAVSNNSKLGPAGMKTIGSIVRNTGDFEELKIDACGLTKQKTAALRSALSDARIDNLDINYNRKMGTKGARNMGLIIEGCKTNFVNMSRCDQSAAEIEAFANGLGTAQLTTLDITTHELIKMASRSYIRAIAKLLPHITGELRMIDWDMSEDNRSVLQEQINISCQQGFKLVYGANGAKVLTREQNVG